MTTINIERQMRARFYVSYCGNKGTCRKGFCSYRLAAQFAAKEALLDFLLGARKPEDCVYGDTYWRRPGNIDTILAVFDCVKLEENGLVEHHRTYRDGFLEGDEYDITTCVESGKAFCAAGWKQAVREISGSILATGKATLPDWVINRLLEHNELEAAIFEGRDEIILDGEL